MRYLLILIFSLLLPSAAASQTTERILVLGCAGTEVQAVAESMRKLAQGVYEVDHHVSDGRLLMVSYHHPTHKAATRAAVAKTPAYSHVVLVDHQEALKYPEFHFEGVYQLQRFARQQKCRPVLLQLPGDPAETAELAYRVGRGTNTPVAPAGYLAKIEPASAAAEVAAAAALAAMSKGKSKIQHPLVEKANEVFLTQEKTKHYEGSYAEKGRVHILPMSRALKRIKKLGVLMTGTSTENGWRKSFVPATRSAKLKTRFISIKNDDEQRSFGESDLAKAKSDFEKYPNSFVLLFARAYTIGAKQIRGSNQKHLQCQIYDKIEPVTKTMNLVEVAKRIFHDFEVKSVYEQARSHDLSLIPLHIAIARIYDEKPELVLSEDNTHMTQPFLDMLAGMSLTSRTSKPIKKPAKSSAYCVRIGYQVLTQLAHLTASGKEVKDKGR